jgi:hypothetical protein
MTAAAASAAGSQVSGAVPGPNDYGTASRTAVTYGMMGMTPLADSEWFWASNLYAGWFYRNGGNSISTCASVHLPSGALVEGVTTFTNDSDGTGIIGYELVETDLHTNTETYLWFFNTDGMPGIERAFRPVVPVFEIRNDRAYTLCISHTTVGPTLQSAGATVWYRLQVSPPPSTASFPNDVPTTHPLFRFVEALAAAGISGGCGAGSFCPDAPLTRGQMAVFLSVALGLHFPN